jgi:hypothetical protein
MGDERQAVTDAIAVRAEARRRSRRTAALFGALSAVALGLTGCAGFTSDPALSLGLDSGLDRPVLLYVNDEWVGTFPVGSDRDDITTGAHGGPAWRIEVRTDAGRTLASFEAVDEAALPVGVAVPTSCGDVAVWAGQPRPDPLEPDPGATPIACD